MAFEGNYSISQNLKDAIITDTSTGVDATITTRYIWIIRSDGTYQVPEGTTTQYIEWPLSDGPTKTIVNLFANGRDIAPNVRVQWYTPTPDPAGVYEKIAPQLFRYFGMNFMYGLTQEQQVARPRIVSWNDFIQNKNIMHTYYLEAVNSIAVAGDVVNAQGALNSAYNMMTNFKQYF